VYEYSTTSLLLATLVALHHSIACSPPPHSLYRIKKSAVNKLLPMADTKKSEPSAEGREVKEESTREKTDVKSTSISSSNTTVATTTTAAAIEISSPSPGITVSLFIFWILPILVLTLCSHLAFDKDKAFHLNIPEDRNVAQDLGNTQKMMNKKKKNKAPNTMPSSTPGNRKSGSSPRPSPLPSAASNWPTSYKQAVTTIQKRGRKVPRVGTTTNTNSAATVNSPSSGGGAKETPISSKETSSSSAASANRDPQRYQYEERIDEYRKEYEADPENVFKAIKLADALRLYDVTYHDGGTKQPEAIATYEKAIAMALAKRERMLETGEETKLSGTGTRSVPDEVMLDYPQKSTDGLLCALYTAFGKVYFMANMFERAVDTYTKCLELEPLYLDALG